MNRTRQTTGAPQTPFEREQEERAAAEAAHVGGAIPEAEADLDPAERAVREAGGGEAEGFEQAQDALVEHASHGDQQSAHAILHDELDDAEPGARREDSEADFERSSERLDRDD